MELDLVVETPEGSRNKYEMDHQRGRIRLDRTLFTATQYPADYGYFPGTVAEDAEPLDGIVHVGHPTRPGCVLSVRPIAVFWMRDEQGPDAKILCVPAKDPRTEHVQDIDDVPQHELNEIGHFFDIYKRIEPGKSSEGRGWQGRAEAENIVDAAFRLAETSQLQPGVQAPSVHHVEHRTG